MGSSFSSTLGGLFGRARIKVLLIGLDSVGKTTALYRLKMGEAVDAAPTISFNVEDVEHKNIIFTIWDFSGQDRIRPLRYHYSKGARGIIFVVDASDRERVDQARYELSGVLTEEELKDTPLLILANKQDLPDAMSEAEIADSLNLRSLGHRQWHIQPSCATTGHGLREGLDWLACQTRTVS